MTSHPELFFGLRYKSNKAHNSGWHGSVKPAINAYSFPHADLSPYKRASKSDNGRLSYNAICSYGRTNGRSDKMNQGAIEISVGKDFNEFE